METQPGCERFSSLYCLHTFYRLHATSNGGSESIIQLIAFMDYWRNWFQKTKMPWREGAAFPEVWTGNEKKELTAMMKCVGKLSTDDGCVLQWCKFTTNSKEVLLLVQECLLGQVDPDQSKYLTACRRSSTNCRLINTFPNSLKLPLKCS